MEKDYPIRNQIRDAADGLLSDSSLALGLLIGLVLSILAYLGLELWGSETVDETHEILAIVPIIVSLIVAGISTFIAVMALKEQRATRQAGTDPVMITHFGQREDAREIVTFCLSNVGAGPALNVKLKVTQPDEDISKRHLFTNVFKEHHPYTVVLQGQTIHYSLSTGPNLFSKEPLKPFFATVAFSDLSGRQYTSTFKMDVREMEGLGAEQSPHIRIAKAVEKLAVK